MRAETSIEDLSVAARLDRLEVVVRDLERRLSALESAGVSRDLPEARRETAPSMLRSDERGASARPDQLDVAAVLSLFGRTFMVFGGAYLFRALTDSGRLPGVWGVAVGLLYAGIWLGAADRAAARGARASALFHGSTTMLIGFPLLWETFARFHLLGAAASAAFLAVLTAVALFVAWRRHLQSLAALCTLGAIATGFALMAAAGVVAPFATLLILLGVATLWLSYDRDWYWLRWPAALGADVVVVGLVARAIKHPPLEAPGLAIAAALLLLAGYLGSVATRTLLRGRLVIPFEVTQSLAVVVVGLGGAFAVARSSGVGEQPLGLASVALGIGGYAVASAFVERRQGLGANFYFYTTLALVMTLVGVAILFSDAGFGVVAASLGIVSAWVAHTRSRIAFALHAAVYVIAASAAAGLITRGAVGLIGTIDAAGAPLGTSAWIALLAPVACLAVARPLQSDVPDWVASVPRLAIAAALVVSLGGVMVQALAAFLGASADPGIVATIRTGVMAAAAVVLAVASRSDRGRELGWLLYPVLAFGAAKLLLEDFQQSRPATLFIALALFGAALVAAPRLVRRNIGLKPDAART